MKRTVLALSIAMLSYNAYADFMVFPSTPDPVAPTQQQVSPAQRAPVFPGATQVNKNQTNIQQDASLVGKVKIPLNQALKNIMPVGYQGHADKSMNWNYPIEVSTTGDFKSDLTQLSRRYNLRFTVDEQKKRLYVTVGEGGIKDSSVNNRNEGLVTNLQQASKAPSKSVNGGSQLVIERNQAVTEALEVFLADHGYDLEWAANNHPVLSRKEVFTGPITKILDESLLPLGYVAKIYQSPDKNSRPTVVVKTAADVIKEMQDQDIK